MQRISIWERILENLFPWRRRRRKARLKAIIDWLMDHPEEPVEFK